MMTPKAKDKSSSTAVRLEGAIYDYPKYYDLIFGSDCLAEMNFLQECFHLFADREVTNLFEPACGTGRLMIRFAKLGFKVSGLDLNEKAIDFCNRRLERNGFKPTGFVGDMCEFSLAQPADAAFNTINSFRHLEAAQQAGNHLSAMADAIAPGGLYVLGLHLSPTGGATIEEESWSASRGSLTVNTDMWLVDRDLSKRYETYKMKYEVITPSRYEILEDQFNFRTYSSDQILELIASEPRWEIAEIYDFAYDVESPIELDETTEDIVFVLRRAQ